MTLFEHLRGSGQLLFRWRSFIPLVLLPMLLLPFVLAHGAALRLSWEVLSASVALFGEAIRFYVSGTAPAGTSERSTTSPRAAILSTTGIYSVVRHPLYIANTLTMVGLGLFPGRWELPVIILLASLLYYERIAVHEEAFLEGRFGDEFRAYAARVRALVPGFSAYQPPQRAFNLLRAIEREFNGVLAIAASLFVLDLFDDSTSWRDLHVSPVWTAFLITSSLLFIVMAVRKRWLFVRPATA